MSNWTVEGWIGRRNIVKYWHLSLTDSADSDPFTESGNDRVKRERTLILWHRWDIQVEMSYWQLDKNV